jgi:HAD superfamily hydrolase (TIGR01509 family)
MSTAGPDYEGVEAFLKSRGISIPRGTSEDKLGSETIYALGNRKNAVFNQIIEREGVSVFDSTIAMIREMLERGIRVGLATSSYNSATILGRTGTTDLFETVVDGLDLAVRGLRGKPEPDIFKAAAANLDVSSDQTIIFEDAVSGVRAGAKGRLRARHRHRREDNAHELSKNGADVVVADLRRPPLSKLTGWFRTSALAPGEYSSGDRSNPMRKKPLLSFWQLWNMSFGYVGIQFGFALQNANVSRIFETLGAKVDEIPILWIAGPVRGCWCSRLSAT